MGQPTSTWGEPDPSQCRSGLTRKTMYVQRHLVLLCLGPVDESNGFARYQVGTNFCLEFGRIQQTVLDCQLVQRDFTTSTPGAVPEPDRTWDRNGVILYSEIVGGNPNLNSEFFDENPYLMPGIVIPYGLPLSANNYDGSLRFRPYFTNISVPGIYPADISLRAARRLAFNDILGTWTCSSNNSLGGETCSSTIRECGKNLNLIYGAHAPPHCLSMESCECNT